MPKQSQIDPRLAKLKPLPARGLYEAGTYEFSSKKSQAKIKKC